MKAKLLRKLRNEGKDCIEIHKVVYTNGIATGISIAYNRCDKYLSDIWSFGMTKERLLELTAQAYIEHEIDNIRNKYKKYSRKYKLAKQ
jgi:hypothetical protein